MRDMLKKCSAAWLLFTGFALTIILMVSGAGYFVIERDYDRFKMEAQRLREDYINGQRQLVKDQVERVVDLTRYYCAKAEERLKNDIKNRTYEAFDIATNLHRENHGKESEQEIRNIILEALRPINFNHGRGYYFATGLDGVEILFADRPELEGQSMLDTRDTRGAYVIRDMIELVRRNGEGFYEYRWTKPNTLGRDFRKIAFIKYFAPFDGFIGTGEYLDDVEQDIQEEVLSRISRMRFGKEGYIFVVRSDGLTLMNSAQPEFIGKDISDMTDVNGVKVFQEERKAADKPDGDFIRYDWEKPSTKEISSKVSFVKGFAHWHWIVGAGFYANDIETVIKAMDASTKREMLKDLYRFGFILTLLLVTTLLICFCLSRYFKRQLDLFLLFFKEAETGGKPLAAEHIFLREFRLLGQSANSMLKERHKAEQGLKEAAQLLEQSRNMLQLIIESIPVRVFWKDMNLRYLGCNTIFARDAGFSQPEQIVGKDDFAMSWREQAEIYQADDSLVMESGTPRVNIVEPQTTPAGSKIWLNTSKVPLRKPDGEVFGVLGIYEDVTERRQAEEALQKSEERFRQAMEATSDGLWDWDSVAGDVYYSPSYFRMLGYEPEEFLPKVDSWLNLVHPDDRGRALAASKACIRNDSPSYSVEYRMRARDGAWRWILGRGKAILRGTDGHALHMIGTNMDITERKHSEQERTRVETRLRQAQKMEALGTLAGGIAHDFNNMLGIIMGFTEMAKLESDEGSPLVGNLDEVLKAANRAKELVKQILAFSRRSEQQMVPLQLGTIVKEAMQILRPSLPSTIEIKTVVLSKTAVLADPTQMHQVLMNFCANAAHAMQDEGGTLEVGVADIVLGNKSVGSPEKLPPGRYVALSVKDSGHGIDPGIIDSIFDPFFTTKKVGEGTGLGLSVVHGIVESHGGVVAVESTPEKGTMFTVFIPALETDWELRQAETAVALPRGQERILVVDDEPQLAEMVKQMLAKLGYDAVSRTNGIEALEAFRHQQRERHFDLVITDMTMPHLTGLDLAHELSGIQPGVPVILMTGFSNKIDANKAKELGIQGFLMKPVTTEELARMVRKVLDKEG